MKSFPIAAVRQARAIMLGGATLLILFGLRMLARSEGIPGVIAPGSEPELIQQGFMVTEGPVGTPDAGLYFSDLRASKTYLLGPNGKITVFRENTNGMNGLALTPNGDLLGAEQLGKRISKRKSDGQVLTITEGISGMPLLAPNDLIVDSKGGVYFTDHGPRPVPPGSKAYVYYLPVGAREPKVLDDTITRPNGLTLTQDGKTLIVDDSFGDTVFAFDVQANGLVKNKHPFAALHGTPSGGQSDADGMALDRMNRVYIATGRGIQVFDSMGQYMGTITMEQQPRNMAFSGADKRTLYITANQGLYRLKMLARGPDRLGK